MKFFEKKENVYIHSRPENSELYETIWSFQHSAQKNNQATWGIDRKRHLRTLVGIPFTDLTGIRVLDLCCGLGRLSAACLEENARSVVCADGTWKGPNSAYEKIVNLDSAYADRLTPVQLDVEKIDECFEEMSFDFIIHYHSLQHMKDFKSTLTSMRRLLNHRGIMSFNFFTTGTTPQIVFDIRKILKVHPLSTVVDLVSDLGKIQGIEKKFGIVDLMSKHVRSDLNNKYESLVIDLLPIVKKYGYEDFDNHVHLEDFMTPYLHNFDHDEILKFVQQDLEMEVIRSSPPGWITAWRK